MPRDPSTNSRTRNLNTGVRLSKTRTNLVILAWIAVGILNQAPLSSQTVTLPTLRIDAPATLDILGRQVGEFPLTGLTTAMRLAGLVHPGPPIDVLLIAESSDLARGTPDWISGFADASRSVVVLFPGRARSYPSHSLEMLLQHEIAHVLYGRAARHQPLPRWFNEGLALAAERPSGLGDYSRLASASARYGRISLEELEQLFRNGRESNQHAYAVSSALVRDLLQTYGESTPGLILTAVGNGATFEQAFKQATGDPLQTAVHRFWVTQPRWSWWFSFLTGPTFLWMIITGLAVYAILTHRRQRAEQRRRWEEEERLEERVTQDQEAGLDFDES